MWTVNLQETALYHFRTHVILVDPDGLPGAAADLRHKPHKSIQPFPVMGMPLQEDAVTDILPDQCTVSTVHSHLIHLPCHIFFFCPPSPACSPLPIARCRTSKPFFRLHRQGTVLPPCPRVFRPTGIDGWISITHLSIIQVSIICLWFPQFWICGFHISWFVIFTILDLWFPWPALHIQPPRRPLRHQLHRHVFLHWPGQFL